MVLCERWTGEHLLYDKSSFVVWACEATISLSKKEMQPTYRELCEKAFVPTEFLSLFLHLQCSNSAVRHRFESDLFGEADV